jgi:hypothetical protein
MMQHHKSLCFHNFTKPIFCKAPFLFHTMNYLLSGNETFTSPQQGKQKDLQLDDDLGAFLFVNATNSDKLGTYGNLHVKSDFEFDDLTLDGVVLPLQSMENKMKPRLLLSSFDKAKPSAEVMMASPALEVLVSDEDWIETLYRESQDNFWDDIDLLPIPQNWGLPCSMNGVSIPATITPPRRFGYAKDISKQKERLDGEKALETKRPKPVPGPSSIPATITPPRRFGHTKDISKQKERLDGQKALESERPKPVPVPSSQGIISSDKVTVSTSRVAMEDLNKEAGIMLSFKRSRKAPKLFEPDRFSRSAKKPRTQTSCKSIKKPDLLKSMPTKKSVKPDVVKSKPTFTKTKLNAKLQEIEIEQLPATSCKKIHDSQAIQWSLKFSDFLEFKKEHGHTGMFLPDGMSFALLDCFQLTYACYSAVPHWYQPNMQLSRWVKRQRYQYKLRKAGRPSTLTDSRIEKLQNAGFIWDSHSNVWVVRHNDLCAFERENGHCNVAFDKRAGAGQHNALASWVKHQRRQCKLLLLGEPTHMTPERKNKLDHLGFQWRIKYSRRNPTASRVGGVQI